MADRLLTIEDLSVRFHTDDGVVNAVNGVSLAIDRGDVFAIVGESGSGKSVTAMSVLQLLPTPPADIWAGSIEWCGTELLGASAERMREVRGGEISMIFQDPLTALNPVRTVGRQIVEMIRAHQTVSKKTARQMAIDALGLVGIPQPSSRVDMYPHEFSGGMRQRAMIAMAIANRPALLIADEPTTALDVTVQAQVLDVLVSIKEELDSAIMLITHDLGVVAGLANKAMVMYAGRPVERGAVDDVYDTTSHPYTLGLLQSLPAVDGSDIPLRPIGGQPPSMINVPSGCPFHPRCRFAQVEAGCDSTEPMMVQVGGGDGTHSVACFRAEQVRLERAGERA